MPSWTRIGLEIDEMIRSLVKENSTHRFPRSIAFSEAVDTAAARPPAQTDRYRYHDEAYRDIQAIFADIPPNISMERRPLNGHIASELRAVTKEIVLSSLLARTPQEPYLSIAHILRDALYGQGLIPTVAASDERWIDAIHIAWTYNQRKDPQNSPSHHPEPETITFARAVLYFNGKGIDLSLEGDEIVVSSNAVWTALAATVASPFLALGDSKAIAYMDGWLAARFDPILCRVHLHPTPDLMGRKLDRMLPCGHLYHTAIKALGRNRVHERRLATPASIAEGATHLAALYEVEPFTGYETLFPPHPERIFRVLVGVALYDELFNIPQCNPAHVGSFLLGLFESVASPTVSAACGWRLHDAVALWYLLLSLAPRSGASTFVKKSQLRSLLSQRVGPSTCNALLDTFVVSNPNRNYRVPSDATTADTRECAIVEASGARYWIPPQPFLGPAFVARLISRYAGIDRDASSKIGVAFEEQMLQRMRELGIECRRADVGTKKAKAGDIDIIVETNEFFCLFELKKKGLTRRTNAGNDAHLAIDLARGVVHGVNQLMRHELSLLRDGYLRLRDGSLLTLNDRPVIKCVISLADYGGFHDGAILRNMLTSFRQVTLTPNGALDDEMTRGLEEANAEFGILQTQCAEFERLRPNDKNGPFDNLLFHNVFYLEHALLSAPTAESLMQELIGRYRVATGSRDAIFDHALFHQHV